MNIIKFPGGSSKIVFCFVDRTDSACDGFSKELIKNQSDFTISNLHIKGYDVYQGLDEDTLLQAVSKQIYTHAVVFSTGTEFINGMQFFDAIDELCKQQFFIAGHVLDRGDAYYELHQQCYIVNLSAYKEFNCPIIGQQELGASHTQVEPIRSTHNIHDDYTPTWVDKGWDDKLYSHKAHGWNILSVAFANNETVEVFTDSIRDNKRHHYPESKKDWQKHLPWIYHRERVCATRFVHTQNNEWANAAEGDVQQLFIPASGTVYFELLNPNTDNTVIFYDYNLRALDYWRNHAPKLDNVTYKFVHLDLLGEDQDITQYFDNTLPTMINLSNIFCYEGTTMLSPLTHRVYKENQILEQLIAHIPDAQLNFTMRAASGFTELRMIGRVREFTVTDIKQLIKPTWHINQDWC